MGGAKRPQKIHVWGREAGVVLQTRKKFRHISFSVPVVSAYIIFFAFLVKFSVCVTGIGRFVKKYNAKNFRYKHSFK